VDAARPAAESHLPVKTKNLGLNVEGQVPISSRNNVPPAAADDTRRIVDGPGKGARR